ncbi:T7SS effector LXG polymorphic toxin [Vagococcus salmoninarum]|uniref:LXG domain-containing protein n=1 Tax=Vagococcus salmoninarum TaxID=2739 RepID=A0A429ZK08_9ENTE|nr:T7SS effector LXG polymorphic toxin [Vagococcus salmoninarum]RST94022.1 hypothetical protein CBF35_11245 [Vagococcus salmoninarum]
MGLIYSSADSDQLISALGSNIRSAKETTDQLKSGSQKIVAAVDGKTLAGAAYTAGKGLFSDLIIPTISKITTAFDQLAQELQTYQSADDIIKSEGSYLDEDIIKRQIEIKKNQKSSALSTVSTLANQIKLGDTPEMSSNIRNTQREMTRFADSLSEEIRKLEKTLQALQTFSSSTSSLFSQSLNDLKLAMQSVLVLSNTIVKSDGTYVLPVGTDKSWFTLNKSESDTAVFKNMTMNVENNLTEKQKIELDKELDGLPKNKQEEALLKWFEKNVFPISQDVALALLEEHGDELGTILFSTSAKSLGTPVSGALYSGSKILGNASKTMPIIGSVIDYSTQIMDGENSTDALVKTGAHAVGGILIGSAIVGIGLTGLPAIASGIVIGTVVNWVIDTGYDRGKNAVGKAIKSIKNKWKTVWK